MLIWLKNRENRGMMILTLDPIMKIIRPWMDVIVIKAFTLINFKNTVSLIKFYWTQINSNHVQIDSNIDDFDTSICISVDQYECNELDTSVSVLLYAPLQFHQRGNLAVCVNAAAFRCHRAVCFSSLVFYVLLSPDSAVPVKQVSKRAQLTRTIQQRSKQRISM